MQRPSVGIDEYSFKLVQDSSTPRKLMSKLKTKSTEFILIPPTNTSSDTNALPLVPHIISLCLNCRKQISPLLNTCNLTRSLPRLDPSLLPYYTSVNGKTSRFTLTYITYANSLSIYYLHMLIITHFLHRILLNIRWRARDTPLN